MHQIKHEFAELQLSKKSLELCPSFQNYLANEFLISLTEKLSIFCKSNLF